MILFLPEVNKLFVSFGNETADVFGFCGKR